MRSLAVSILLTGSRKDCAFSRMRSERKYTYFGKLKTNLCFVFMQQLRRLAWALALATRQCTKNTLSRVHFWRNCTNE